MRIMYKWDETPSEVRESLEISSRSELADLDGQN